MRDVCNYYKCYRRHGWNRVLIEIGIRPGSIYYSPFDDRINYHSNCWHEHYCSTIESGLLLDDAFLLYDMTI